MARYHNERVTKKIGKQIKKVRLEKGLTIDIIAQRTGFNPDTILNIENGADTDLTHLCEIAFACGVQPKTFLDIAFDIKTRFKEEVKINNTNKASERIIELIASGFLDEERTNKEICDKLNELYNEAPKYGTRNLSVSLARLVLNKRLFVKDDVKPFRYRKWEKKR